MKIDLLGVYINNQTKREILAEIQNNLSHSKQTFIVTPYSEFIQRCFRDQRFRSILNSADISLPDGIATIWLAHYLNLALKSKYFYIKIFEAFFQMIWSGLKIIFRPQSIKNVIPEKISGSDFFWDLVKLASKKELNIFLLGGYGDTTEIVCKKIAKIYPDLKVVGISNSDPQDQSLVEKIRNSRTDILLVAFGPVTQEIWISENLKSTGVKLAIGLGGTFDYVAGKKLFAPKWIRAIGLEWFFRLLTQPQRFKRIWNATFGLLLGTIRFKVWKTMGLRKNVVGVIINRQGQVLLASRIFPGDWVIKPSEGESSEHWQFPQGGVKDYEDLKKAVVREVQEETGMRSLKILGQSEQSHFYVWNNTLRPLWFNALKYRGQEQTIFFLKFEGQDSEIKIDNQEFIDWKWVDIKDLEQLIHPFRLPLAKIVISEISKYLNK
jgi:N-acetylglucosaminyldiphosphoundecaprenol N-acetyl-beta-D-mannosaminyltransferase